MTESGLSQRDRAEILRARARALAQPVARQGRPAGAEHLVFALGKQRYAIDLQHVSEVLGPTVLTRIPNAPPFLAGVFNLRGEIVSVIHLTEVLRLPENKAAGNVVMLASGAMRFGLLADEIQGTAVLDPATIERLPSAREDAGRYVKGLSGDLLVLDGAALLAAPELIVNQE